MHSYNLFSVRPGIRLTHVSLLVWSRQDAGNVCEQPHGRHTDRRDCSTQRDRQADGPGHQLRQGGPPIQRGTYHHTQPVPQRSLLPSAPVAAKMEESFSHKQTPGRCRSGASPTACADTGPSCTSICATSAAYLADLCAARMTTYTTPGTVRAPHQRGGQSHRKGLCLHHSLSFWVGLALLCCSGAAGQQVLSGGHHARPDGHLCGGIARGARTHPLCPAATCRATTSSHSPLALACNRPKTTRAWAASVGSWPQLAASAAHLSASLHN